MGTDSSAQSGSLLTALYSVKRPPSEKSSVRLRPKAMSALRTNGAEPAFQPMETTEKVLPPYVKATGSTSSMIAAVFV